MLDLALAKQHLRVLHSDDDGLIGTYLAAAERWAENYTGKTLVAIGEAADGEIPADLTAAILLMVGHLYSNREAVTSTPLAEAPLGSIILAHPYRDVLV